MHQTRENLDILFRRIAPETVLTDIYMMLDGKNLFCQGNRDALFPETYRIYDHFGVHNLREYSIDEVKIRYEDLKNQVDSASHSIFDLLLDYAQNILVYQHKQPICRLEKILDWNSITKRLGQDIFTMAWLAKKDCDAGDVEPGVERSFDWPAVLKTDDFKLNRILEKGLAENHFHLNGSTQSFALSWACLMNHPDCIAPLLKYKNQFDWSMNAGMSGSVVDEQVDWKMRLIQAAYIRALLFSKCLGEIDSKELEARFSDFVAMPLLSCIKGTIDHLRFSYGVSFEQVKKRTYCCLDYAICKELYHVNADSHNRLLGGERNFLYQCFVGIMKNEFNDFEKKIFYAYLLIKTNFRAEIIQTNGRLGFQNFSEYQDRKIQFFGNRVEYWNETQRLSVCTAIEENNIQLLEARIMPRNRAGAIAKDIKDYDNIISFASEEDRKRMFYVTHFPKSSRGMNEKSADGHSVKPRNCFTRIHAEKCAKALYKFKKNYPTYSERIFGIDACSNEIACRPETFATEFRFLKNEDVTPYYKWYNEPKKINYSLKATYHVGEDFLDLCDGLRAIDEALLYLNLQKGDRLGHAIVLGTDPEKYYNLKRRNIYLTKQDYLDNCIWVLKRSLEWGIPMELDNREMLKDCVGDLLNEIYNSPSCDENVRNAYFASWILRGDHPTCYKTGKYVEPDFSDFVHYNRYLTMGSSYDKYRKNDVVSGFLYDYHYNKEVREKGLKIAKIEVADWHIELMSKFQQQIRKIVAQKGISVECNPTSNVLIGTFFQYDSHPILQFNDFKLTSDSVKPQINVSINTDDIGVFDTSLSNEYALLLSAIVRKRHQEKNYNDEAVYEYLDYLRQNGLNMSFGNNTSLF